MIPISFGVYEALTFGCSKWLGRWGVKFEFGLATKFFVVQAQRDLATAQESELRAILDYQRALIDFERVQQTSLGAAGISIVTGGGAG